MIEIYNNLIADSERSLLEQAFFSNKFPWYFFQKSVDIDKYDTNKFYSPGVLRHCFMLDGKINSEWSYLLNPIMNRMAELFGQRVKLIQCHANLMMPSVSLTDKLDIPHIDINNAGSNCFTAIYYLENNNSTTTIFENSITHNLDIDLDKLTVKQEIASIRNSLAVWPNNFVHCAPGAVTSPRAVINFNFYK